MPCDVFALASIMLWSFVSWLLFIRLSMIPMEKALKQKGVNPSAWDGIGIRAVWYAWAIVFQGTKLQQ
ncbi:MAG: hypothetical protein MI864_14280, partial [Pseudomonadales bacterium]|nr:hypothetical protein [Pseudomonadales bacterium]